jgi:acyl phosphate:glycerol-3-phosphate acyltransferase
VRSLYTARWTNKSTSVLETNLEYVYSFAAMIAAYLIGSLSFAVIVSKAFGLSDPRTYGSKNPGATNVLRSGSKKAAMVTLVLDALKGFVPVFLVKLYGEPFGMGSGTLAAVAFAAFMGHLFPIFFKFKGGKGVATAAGVVLGIDFILGGATLLSFGILLYFFRWVSLASIASAGFAVFFYLLGDRAVWYTSKPVMLALFLIALVLAVRHKDNINRLLTGTEPKIGEKKKS